MLRVFLILAALLSAGSAMAQSFSISAVDFGESAYLEETELQAIAADYVNRPIVFSDLQEMVTKIQLLYAERGIVTAKAVLPPQEIRDGVLRIDLVEATIEDVRLEGFERTDPEFVRRTISLEPGKMPDFEVLERELRIYDISYDLAPTLTFGAGETPGTTVAVIAAEEPRKFEWTVSADNFGSEETGIYRGSVFGRWNSVSGWRDVLSMQATVSEGSYSGSLGYSRPVGGGGGTVIGTASYAHTEIVQGSFEPVDVVSDSYTASLSYRRPLRVRPRSHFIIDVGIAGEMSTSTIEATPFSDIQLGEFVLQGTYVRQFDTAQIAVNFGAKAGFSDAANTSETEGEFYLGFGGISYSQAIAEKALLDISLKGQYALEQNLPVARLFSVGGATSVRGYPNNIRGGDSGALLKAQIAPLRPFEPESMEGFGFSPYLFVDAAFVMPYRVDNSINPDQDYLASAGVGLRVDWNDKVSALLMVAVPLIDTLGFDGSGDGQVFFGLDYRF